MIVDPKRLISRARSIGTFAQARITDRRDRQFQRHAAIVRAGMQVPTLPRRRRQAGSVWAVTMVKNEADIIEASVRHLFEQGITSAIIADNGSTDDTPAILRRLAAELPIYLATDTEPAYYQDHKMSLLADAARRAGADWVIPFDADEFWFSPIGTVASWLQTTPADVVSALIYNVFPSSLAQSGWVMDHENHMHPKVAFRASRGAFLTVGNHQVSHPGRQCDGLLIAHQPWRSYEQFAQKMRQGAHALAQTDLHPAQGAHWRVGGQLDDDALRAAWADLLAGVDEPALGWSPIGDLRQVDDDPARLNPAQLGLKVDAASANRTLGYALPAGMEWDDVTTAARAMAARVAARLDVVHSVAQPPRVRQLLRHWAGAGAQSVRRLVSAWRPRPGGDSSAPVSAVKTSVAVPDALMVARVADLPAAVRRWPVERFAGLWVMTSDGDLDDVAEAVAALSDLGVDRCVVPTAELADALRSITVTEPVVVPWRSDVRGVRLPARRTVDVLLVGVDAETPLSLPDGVTVRWFAPQLLTVFERRRELRAALAKSKCVVAADPRVLAEAADLGAISLPVWEVADEAVAAALGSWTAEGARRRWELATARTPMLEQVAAALTI